MVTSDLRPTCLFNNCAQFTTFYMQRFTTVLQKMQTKTQQVFCLLLVIVMESMKSNVSVNYVEGILVFRYLMAS